MRFEGPIGLNSDSDSLSKRHSVKVENKCPD